MAKYRKVDTRIWNDSRFRELSAHGKLAFLFILTHPNMTPLGAMRGTVEGLSAELPEALPKGFREAFAERFIKYDPKACFVWLPNFLKYNRPENPNVLISWQKCLDDLPECEMKTELLWHIKDFTKGMSKGFREAFRKAFGDTFAETGTGTGTGLKASLKG